VSEIEGILDLNEAAAIAGVTPARLRQLIDAGQLPGKKIGNSWAILATDLNTLLGRTRGGGRPDERAALASRLFLDLRGNSAIHISLVDPLPELSLWFKVDNRSSIDVELDRLLVTVSYLFPVAEGAVLDRYLIPANKWNDGIHFHQYLPIDRAMKLRQLFADDKSGQSLQVHATAYFNTPFDTIVVYNHMITRGRREFPVNLPPA
jgi:hypothetical protein